MIGQARKRKGCCSERGLSGWGRCIRCVREGRGGEPEEGKAELVMLAVLVLGACVGFMSWW
jgi:hypothetical protein